MAGASDKARFYLEKSVPELQDLQRKKIFTKQEVSSIIKKRSDFEHKLNARGSRPSDYANYVAYEINLDTLRRKRSKHLGVKAASHSGQRRIFFVLKRATRKFYGDIGLWMQYVSFARKQKSNKKVSEIFTQMIRLFPTNQQIWIYAASYALEERGDMMEARGLMQKGLRFCKRSEELWVDYARLEMIYIAKLAARSKILGLNQPRDRQTRVENRNEDAHGGAGDLLRTTAEYVNTPEVQDGRNNQDALEKLSYMPAGSRNIPVAIFDAAMKELKNNTQFALAFFDMIAEFNVEPRQGILAHISDFMQSTAPTSFEVLVRFVQQPVIGLDPTDIEFPMSLSTSLDRLELAFHRLETSQCRQLLYDHVVDWVRKLLETEDLHEDIRKVLQVVLKKAQKQSEAIGA